ncbi:hypothetical protein Tco_0732453 [Tanacetum coccineum]
MSFITMADEITLESLTEEQFECFIEYYHENYLEDFKSKLENLKEIYKMMNGSNFVGETLRKSDHLHQTFEKSSIAMTHGLSYGRLDDEPIGDLCTMEDKVDNPSPQCTPQVLPSIELYTPPVTHPKEVEETIGIPIEVIFDEKKHGRSLDVFIR